MYLDNKYTRWYYSIVNNAQLRVLDGYKEKHHIIPKSLGGTNELSNLVALTAREHFVCHRLLIKMTTGQQRTKMVRALSAFRAARSYQERKLTSKQYESIRKETAGRAWNTGIPHSAETRAKISAKAAGRKRNLSPESLESMKEKLRARVITEEHRANLSKALTGRVSPTKGMTFDGITHKKQPCPECGKLIGVNAMIQHRRAHKKD